MTQTMVSKGQFAKMVGRQPSAVSKWISEGKLRAPALVGTGHRAEIIVELALQQLQQSLDPSQQVGTGRPIPASLPLLAAMPAPAVPGNDDTARLAKARADQAELDLAVSRAKAAELEGRWLVAADAQEAWAAELASVYRGIETWLLTTLPGELAALETHDARSIGSHLKQGFRELRQRIADQAAAPRPVPGHDVDPDEEDDGEE